MIIKQNHTKFCIYIHEFLTDNLIKNKKNFKKWKHYNAVYNIFIFNLINITKQRFQKRTDS